MREFPLHAKYQQKVQSTDTGLENNNRCHIKLHTVFTRLKAALERIEGILPSTAIKIIPTPDCSDFWDLRRGRQALVVIG